MPRHVTLRSKSLPFLPEPSDLDPAAAKLARQVFQADFAAEYVAAVMNILIGAMFLVGSVCFFGLWPLSVYYAGDWLFIIASVLNSILAAWNMYDCYKVSQLMFSSEKEHNYDEFLEALFYFLSNIVFAVGSILFMPHLYMTKEAELWGKETGAWFYIVGSFGFVTASYWNALGMATKTQGPATPVGKWCHRVASAELLLTLMGSVLFVVASFLYRPTYNNHCDERDIRPPAALQIAEGSSHSAARHLRIAGATAAKILHPAGFAMKDADNKSNLCLEVEEQGTWMYVIGSTLFLLQASLHLMRTTVSHSAVGMPDVDPKEP